MRNGCEHYAHLPAESVERAQRECDEVVVCSEASRHGHEGRDAAGEHDEECIDYAHSLCGRKCMGKENDLQPVHGPYQRGLEHESPFLLHPENAAEALEKAGREDLIGDGPKGLVREFGPHQGPKFSSTGAYDKARGSKPKAGAPAGKPSASKTAKGAKPAKGGKPVAPSEEKPKTKFVRKEGWAKAKPKPNAKPKKR